MRSRRDRRARRDAMLADSAQVGLLGYPRPQSEADALRLALFTLHGVRAYAHRIQVEHEAGHRTSSMEALSTVESHCRQVLARLAAFDEEDNA